MPLVLHLHCQGKQTYNELRPQLDEFAVSVRLTILKLGAGASSSDDVHLTSQYDTFKPVQNWRKLLQAPSLNSLNSTQSRFQLQHQPDCNCKWCSGEVCWGSNRHTGWTRILLPYSHSDLLHCRLDLHDIHMRCCNVHQHLMVLLEQLNPSLETIPV